MKTVNRKQPAKIDPSLEAVHNEASLTDTVARSQDHTLPGSTLDDWSGKVLGEYEIGELLGVGGNGHVFKARHRCLDLPVALKILHGVEPDDEDTVNRFRREAMASARLMHPNLVRATDAGILDQHLYLVTDLVDGVDLSQLVGQHGALSVANACELGRAACEGLQYLADNDTIHRDIKPSNMMLDRDGQVRILDLGLARKGDFTNSLTCEDQLMGTLDFMSPEQALNPKDVDFHADMYSLGCTLYFLLTGEAPFAGEAHDSLAAKLMAHMEVLATPIEEFRKDVPKPVARVVIAMLEKDPADRPADYHEIIQVLSQHTKKHDLCGLVAGHVSSVPIDPSASKSKKRTLSQRRKSKPARRTNVPLLLLGLSAVIVIALFMKAPESPSAAVFPATMAKPDSADAIPECWKDRATSTMELGVEDPELPPPPPGMTPKGIEHWGYYLASPSHKAWVWDRHSGNYGYATDRETVQEAIKEARKYGGPTCKLFSVNGEPVDLKKPSAPIAKGKLTANKFFTKE